MSDFRNLIKEAFVDAEPFDPSPGRVALQASVDKFNRRMRTVRWMSWAVAVPFMAAVMIWALISLLRAPEDTSSNTLFLYGLAFVWASTCVGFTKGWFSMMQNHILVMKELKRMQLMMLEQSGG